MTWIITRELNLFCNPEEIFDFFWQALLVCGLVRFRIFQGYSLFSYQCSLLFPLCSSDLFVIPQLFLSVNNFFKFIFSDFSINCSIFQNIYVPWTRQNVTIAFSFRQVLFLYFYFLLEWNFKFHIYAEFSLSLFLDLSYDFNISYLQ